MMNSTPPKVSIIIPVYNVESYLCRCVDSVISQTFDNIEIILIDDGSPDSCGAICNEYKNKDERIKVIHTTNNGVAEARRVGLESSICNHVIFVDPDDCLVLDAVETLYYHLQDDIDIVFGGYNVIAGDEVYINTEKQAGTIVDNILPLIMMEEVMTSPWAKIYKRSLFNSNSFPKLRKGQDYVMNIKICTNKIRAKFIDSIVYNYFVHDGATTQSVKYSMDIIMQIIDTSREILIEAGIYDQNIELFKSFAAMNIKKIIRDRQLIDRKDPRFIHVIKEVGNYFTYKEKIKIWLLQSTIGQKSLMMSRSIRGLLNKI